MGYVDRQTLKLKQYPAKTATWQDDQGFLHLRIGIRPHAVLPMKTIKSDSHCAIRAFQYLIDHKHPNIGRIGLVLLDDPSRKGMKCLFSFSMSERRSGGGLLKNRWLVIFPGWDSYPLQEWFKSDSASSIVYAAHHITYQSNSKGIISCHVTSPDRGSHKTLSKSLPTYSDGIRLCQIIIQDYSILNGIGAIEGLSSKELSQEDAEKWGQVIKSNIGEKHPLLIPKDHSNKSNKPLIMVLISLSAAKSIPGRIDLPAKCMTSFPMPEDLKSVKLRTYNIALAPELFLNLTIFRTSGSIQRGNAWVFEG